MFLRATTRLVACVTKVLRPVPLSRDGILLGNQTFLLLAPDVAFRMTAVTECRSNIEAHLRRSLALTPLQALQWINFNHATIDLVTLFR